MCEITRIKYYDIENGANSKFLCKCSVILGDVMQLYDIRIFKGEKGNYIVMPKRVLEVGYSPSKDAKKKNMFKEEVFHPVDGDYFKKMSQVILDGYSQYLENGKSSYHPGR